MFYGVQIWRLGGPLRNFNGVFSEACYHAGLLVAWPIILLNLTPLVFVSLKVLKMRAPTLIRGLICMYFFESIRSPHTNISLTPESVIQPPYFRVSTTNFGINSWLTLRRTQIPPATSEYLKYRKF